ncbi:MAG: hypothetical protein FJW86_08125 [Actinobacteria bacterium]|nr:hypothetical protein [Actinomycetota bacterium]
MKTRVVGIGAGMVLVSLLAAAVPAAAGSKPLKPKKWAASFCATIIDVRDDVTEIQNESLDLAGGLEDAIASDPNAIFAYLNGVASGLEDAAEVVTEAAEDIQSLRPPKVKGGGEIKEIIDDLFGGGLELISTEFQTAANDLAAIDDATDDPSFDPDDILLRALERSRACRPIAG